MAVTGDAGAGKSRLLWEFFQYLDGIEEVRWWHQGRCLSYGEGLAYWALAEMVRARARIGEEEPPGAARESCAPPCSWSADFPIFVIALGRPELRDRRPGWELLTLAPLEADAVTAILDGLVPGLPEDLVAQIGRRAEGIPLYAVETMRMLQNRGLLAQEGARYVLTGDVCNLEVPEQLRRAERRLRRRHARPGRRCAGRRATARTLPGELSRTARPRSSTCAALPGSGSPRRR